MTTVLVLTKLNTVRLTMDVHITPLRSVLLTVNVLKMILNVMKSIVELTLETDYQTTVLYSNHSDAAATTKPLKKLPTSVFNIRVNVKKKESVMMTKSNVLTPLVLPTSKTALTKKLVYLTKLSVQITLVVKAGEPVGH